MNTPYLDDYLKRRELLDSIEVGSRWRWRIYLTKIEFEIISITPRGYVVIEEESGHVDPGIHRKDFLDFVKTGWLTQIK